TISSLYQTDPSQLQDKNVFDAQGLRKIAEITQRARVERNVIERESERQVVERNVMTSKKVLELQRDQAEFEAEQKMKVANVRAARDRETQEFKLSQDEAISRRDIEKMKNVETAEVERTLAVEQAQVQRKITLLSKLREQETTDILRKQTVEEAERAREAAHLQYEAKLRLAEGDAQGSMKRAEGERALKMVDITIEREKVTVEQARVDVERQSLANKQEFEGAALTFELEKLRI